MQWTSGFCQNHKWKCLAKERFQCTEASLSASSQHVAWFPTATSCPRWSATLWLVISATDTWPGQSDSTSLWMVSDHDKTSLLRHRYNNNNVIITNRYSRIQRRKWTFWLQAMGSAGMAGGKVRHAGRELTKVNCICM